MNRCGYFIWQLEAISKLYTPAALATLLKQAKTGWVSWKISDGIKPVNQIGGNDKLLIEYMQALEAVGIENSGWSYVYPTYAGPAGALIGERVQKFQGNLDKFDTVFLDVESEWKKNGLLATIDLLLASIDVNKVFNLGFCSYRFPQLHAPLNFVRFLKNDKIKMVNPQVYWMGDHNVTEQLDESYNQYAKLTAKQFVPVGAAWGETVNKVYWEVTEADLRAFVGRCKDRGWTTYGFWSLDWILSHQKYSWLEAISGVQVNPNPNPNPDPDPLPTFVTVTATMANVRNSPEVSPSTDVGDTPRGAQWRVTGQSGDWWKVEAWLAKSVAK
jgi:hypothetical protein